MYIYFFLLLYALFYNVKNNNIPYNHHKILYVYVKPVIMVFMYNYYYILWIL